MGMIRDILGMLFGGNRNLVAETAEVFRVNKENEAQRTANYQAAALAQFGTEFAHARKGWFDSFVDAVNRVPRPAMALGTIGLIASAMIDPIWFGSRMEGLALVPDPLWWLLGAIVSFYFGARHQAKAQGFQTSIAASVSAAQALTGRQAENVPSGPVTPQVADTGTDAGLQKIAVSDVSDNPAFDDWRKSIA